MSEDDGRCRCECRCKRPGLGPSMVCTTCWFHECPPRRAEMDRVWEENEAGAS